MSLNRLNRADVIKLVIGIVACQAAGVIGSVFTTPAIPTWYAGLTKPVFTPPNFLFAPVWITLYLLMAGAVFLVWRKDFKQRGVKVAFILFWVQLVLNAMWTVVFFGFKSLFGGVLVIVLLWLAILANIILFFRISRPAGGLLIPYVLWVTIAANLNVQLWLLNS